MIMMYKIKHCVLDKLRDEFERIPECLSRFDARCQRTFNVAMSHQEIVESFYLGLDRKIPVLMRELTYL